jgi:phenylacetate-CoA ligase
MTTLFPAKFVRRLIRSQLQKTSPEKLFRLGDKKLMQAFRRAANKSPAYRVLLEEAGVNSKSITTARDFVRLCPILEKNNTFQRFPLDKLIANDVPLSQLASVLTSSGHGGGGFALGLSTRAQFKSTPSMIDLGLELAFDIDSHRTLLINCLPMGVTFQSDAVCVANVSVREDMACAIVEQAGALFEQIILCGDPLFLKKLCDYSQEKKLDWSRYRMNLIIGEETFTESFRDYLAQVLHITPDHPKGGLIGSSMGIGELGLNIFNETRETIAWRRACNSNPVLCKLLFGCGYHTLPTFLVFNPLRSFVEIDAIDEHGVGDLLVSVLDTSTPIPLLRYKTGDRARWLSTDELELALRESDMKLSIPRLPMIALLGRAKDRLPGGGHVDEYKHALYQDPELAVHVSGAFRLTKSDSNNGMIWEVQIRQGDDIDIEMLTSKMSRLLADTPGDMGGTSSGNDTNHANSTTLICYKFEDFPYGKTIDYERKFVYWKNH